MSREQHVADVLAEVFRRGGMKRAVRRAEAVLLWPQVVGPEVARFATATVLKNGVLYVETSDSETSMHLAMQRQRFLDVYRGRYGVTEIRDIRFRVGEPDVGDDPAPEPAPVAVDGDELARLSAAVGDLELGELTKPALEAGRAMLRWRAEREAAGWTPCPTCGALAPDAGLCDACERYASTPAVQRASTRLAADPTAATPLLSDDERAVAVHLGLAFLDDGLRPQLEHVARCRVALGRGIAPADVDDDALRELDPRIARVLGRWG